MVRAILNKSYAQRVSLERLSDEDSQAMIRQLLGTATIPAELERLVESHADGNPLFIEELIRDLVEAGDLARDGEGYALTRQADEINLPTTVGGLFLARADGSSPSSATCCRSPRCWAGSSTSRSSARWRAAAGKTRTGPAPA